MFFFSVNVVFSLAMIMLNVVSETRRPDFNYSVREIFSFLYGDGIKLMRCAERLNRKIVSLTYGVIFNKTCIYERLLPNYTNIIPEQIQIQQF